MRLYQMLIDSGIDLAEVNTELTAAIEANTNATPENPATIDPYYVRDPKTGLSPAQVEASKNVADVAKSTGQQVVPGDPGEADRILTPYEKGSNEYAGKTYATAAGAMAAANKAAQKAGPPYEAPAGTHWTLIGTEWKLYQDLTSATTPVTTSVTTATTTSSVTDNTVINDTITALQNQINTLTTTLTTMQNKPTTVGQITRRQTGGIVQVVSLLSDGSEQVIDEYKDYSARDSVMQMFENTGLGQTFLDSLMKSIDQVYADNVAPTDAQILNSIYNSEAYKTRFAANEIIRKRMAEGKGEPGDRLLTPAEYVKTEAAYKEIMSEAGLPPGFYDQPEDFTKFIAELGTSVSEITERVNIAQQALQNADANIKQALKDYYGLTEKDMVAYLLDPDKAFEVVNSRFRYTTPQAKEMYTKAEVGGAALRAGMQGGVSEKFAEEITKAGKANLAEEAFQRSARQQSDYQRLLGLAGEQAGTEDLARESLALTGGAEVGIKAKKLASKERARFAQRSAIDRASLGSRLRTPDV